MQEEQKEPFTIAQANYLSDRERLEYLKQQWGMSDLRVRGRLQQTGDLLWLSNVRSEDGRRLRYPLADYDPYLSGRARIFVGRDSSIAPNVRQSNSDVTALLTLARPHERTKHNNPLLVAADPESIEPLTSMLRARVFHNEDGSIAIEETVRQDYIAQCRAEVDAELAKLTEQIARFREESDALAADLDETKRQHVQEQAALEAMLARQREAQQEIQVRVARIVANPRRIERRLQLSNLGVAARGLRNDVGCR
ncbi:MAG: hypothetical protein GVY09_17020 [Gammaproteobacteria bacterium]|jgi:hypothetical protein|nr:hypothetical protein [Gammaproteobacteria bacterium]